MRKLVLIGLLLSFSISLCLFSIFPVSAQTSCPEYCQLIGYDSGECRYDPYFCDSFPKCEGGQCKYDCHPLGEEGCYYSYGCYCYRSEFCDCSSEVCDNSGCSSPSSCSDWTQFGCAKCLSNGCEWCDKGTNSKCVSNCNTYWFWDNCYGGTCRVTKNLCSDACGDGVKDSWEECEVSDTSGCTSPPHGTCDVKTCSDCDCVYDLSCDGSTCSMGSDDYCEYCEHCADGDKNCGETGVDCGGECAACTQECDKEGEPCVGNSCCSGLNCFLVCGRCYSDYPHPDCCGSNSACEELGYDYCNFDTRRCENWLPCDGLSRTECDANQNCGWCESDGSCKDDETVKCQPGDCSPDGHSKCGSACEWSSCGNTDSSCYCENGGCVACGENEDCVDWACEGVWKATGNFRVELYGDYNTPDEYCSISIDGEIIGNACDGTECDQCSSSDYTIETYINTLYTSVNTDKYCDNTYPDGKSNELEVSFADSAGVSTICYYPHKHKACVQASGVWYCCENDCDNFKGGCDDSVKFDCDDWSCLVGKASGVDVCEEVQASCDSKVGVGCDQSDCVMKLSGSDTVDSISGCLNGDDSKFFKLYIDSPEYDVEIKLRNDGGECNENDLVLWDYGCDNKIDEDTSGLYTKTVDWPGDETKSSVTLKVGVVGDTSTNKNCRWTLEARYLGVTPPSSIPPEGTVRTVKLKKGYNFIGVGTEVTQQEIEEAGCELDWWLKEDKLWQHYDETHEEKLFTVVQGAERLSRLTTDEMEPWTGYLIMVLDGESSEGGCEFEVTETPITQLVLKHGYNLVSVPVRLTQQEIENAGCVLDWWLKSNTYWVHYDETKQEKLFTVVQGAERLSRLTTDEMEPNIAYLIMNLGDNCTVDLG